LYRTNSSQFVDADPIYVLLVSSLLPISINNLSDSLKGDILLPKLYATNVEKGAIHMEEQWILFHKRGRRENYQWKILELLYQPKVPCTTHCAKFCGFLTLFSLLSLIRFLFVDSAKPFPLG